MNKFTIVFLSLSVLTFSCGEKQDLMLTQFENIPENVEGCSCYFSKNSESSTVPKYSFVSSSEGLAYISLNNITTELKLKSSGRKSDTFGDYDYKEIYENDSLKVYLDIKYKGKTGEEVWKNSATMKIENVNGLSTSEKIKGECGC